MVTIDPNIVRAASENVIASRLDANSLRPKERCRDVSPGRKDRRRIEDHPKQGGGAKAIESQHGKNRLTARERLHLLLDPSTDFFELSLFAAHGMYEEWGGAPAAGTLTGLGCVAGKLVMIIATTPPSRPARFFQ